MRKWHKARKMRKPLRFCEKKKKVCYYTEWEEVLVSCQSLHPREAASIPQGQEPVLQARVLDPALPAIT